MLFLVGRLKYQYLDVTKDIALNVDNYFTTNKSSNSEKIAIYKESDNGTF